MGGGKKKGFAKFREEEGKNETNLLIGFRSSLLGLCKMGEEEEGFC